MIAPNEVHDPKRITGTGLHLRGTHILLIDKAPDIDIRQFYTRRITNRGNSFELLFCPKKRTVKGLSASWITWDSKRMNLGRVKQIMRQFELM